MQNPEENDFCLPCHSLFNITYKLKTTVKPINLLLHIHATTNDLFMIKSFPSPTSKAVFSVSSVYNCMITRTVLNSNIFVILCHSVGLSRHSCLFSSLITPNRKYNKVAYWLGWSEEKEKKNVKTTRFQLFRQCSLPNYKQPKEHGNLKHKNIRLPCQGHPTMAFSL